MRAVLYYRGKLLSCNYACPYCPFSKTKDSGETLAQDKRQLETFMGWIRAQEEAGTAFCRNAGGCMSRASPSASAPSGSEAPSRDRGDPAPATGRRIRLGQRL
ncbi:hypothetical protein PMJ22TS4_13540 [Paenibacillus melissococcoides]